MTARVRASAAISRLEPWRAGATIRSAAAETTSTRTSPHLSLSESRAVIATASADIPSRGSARPKGPQAFPGQDPRRSWSATGVVTQGRRARRTSGRVPEPSAMTPFTVNDAGHRIPTLPG